MDNSGASASAAATHVAPSAAPESAAAASAAAPVMGGEPRQFADVPAMIGKYRVEKTLGQGNYGLVKLGVHVDTGMKVGGVRLAYSGQHNHFTKTENRIVAI